MARPMSTIAAGRVNRRFLALALILALLSAVLAYATLSRSGGDGGSGAGRLPVVVAKDLIPAGTQITADLVEERTVPQNVVGEGALTSIEEVVGKIARFPIAANDQVLLSKLVDTSVPSNAALSYVVEEGMRGMAITVEKVVNAGGLVLPGDHVDVLWVPHKGAPSFLLLENIEVTAVEQTIVDIAPAAPGLQQEEPEETTGQGGTEPDGSGGERARVSDAEPQPEAATVTLLLNPQQAQTMFCAQLQSDRFEGAVRLAVRSFGDEAPTGVNAPPCPAWFPVGQEQPS